MTSKLYVGNLPYSVTNASLESNFGAYGGVLSARVMTDRDTGTSKGFGFVEMVSAEAAQAAIAALHGMWVDGRTIVVSEARPRDNKPSNSRDTNSGGYTASHRRGVGYGTDGFGGGTY